MALLARITCNLRQGRGQPERLNDQPCRGNEFKHSLLQPELGRQLQLIKQAPSIVQRDVTWSLVREMVGTAGFEPTTTTPPVWCATRLRYAPRSRILATTPRFGYAYRLHHCFGVGRRPLGRLLIPSGFTLFGAAHRQAIKKI